MKMPITQSKNKLKLLWLPGWYPSKIDFLPGDFTDRHAAAVSKFADVVVLYVTKDPSLPTNQSVVEVEQSGHYRVYRAYYNSPTGMGLLSKSLSAISYYRRLYKLFQIAKNDIGNFDLVHVHISLRQGLFAQWLKRTKRLPYVITEQNSWFMPVGDRYFTSSAIMQKIIRSNFRNANAVHVVSKSLGHQLMLKYPFIKTFTVIPNVVDTKFFRPLTRDTNEGELNFFTITGDIYHKNTDGVIRAFAAFVKRGNTGLLHIAGPNNAALKKLGDDLSIGHAIHFYGAIDYTEVAKQMQQADALIFFTRYETFGCVLAEALCCGTPVIASKIPVLEENLQDFKNALFVSAEDEEDLTQKMLLFVSKRNGFDHKQIADEAHEKYNYENVGMQFLQFYERALGSA